jgi:quercetin dioxygenase-like cupin family protein
MHAHTRSDEIFFGLSGQGTILVEEVAHDVSPGDLVFVAAGERHALYVSESATEPFVILAAVAPNCGDDTVFF